MGDRHSYREVSSNGTELTEPTPALFTASLTLGSVYPRRTDLGDHSSAM